ncbi:cytochrome-c peroxidase [Flammeovirga pacifica]|uniref:Methylamine utilization protein MauG n=1 Tax=Flammeovirga pacifica TaxID=915059 RepID=A0A1S1YYL8_FLAPC|nr:cytochrome c peroxidase [Flammeovirga pacifica]OHX66097.1 cytochrome-c peroxidase [Flammeovirga pacifica]
MKLNFLLLYFLTILFFSACDHQQIEDENTAFDLNIPTHFGPGYILPENNPTTTKGVELGRMLFYDQQLSRDGSTSCGTCHQQALSFTDGKALAEGIHGRVGDFSSMSIVNAMWQGKFFWDGRAVSLEEQALGPIENVLEMDMTLDEVVERLQADPNYPSLFEKAFGSGVITSENIGKAIAQFERTLISSNSKYDQYLKGAYIPTEEELLGIQLFFTHPEPSINLRGGNCGDCHLNILTSGDNKGYRGFHNNGLDTNDDLKIGLSDVTGSDFDKGKFKAPSLRNIAVTAPYMHDGRLATLEDVLEHYDEHIKESTTLDAFIREGSNEPIFPGDPIKLHLTNKEKQAILTFLEMLTDDDFLTNPAFSDPFSNE